MLHPRKRFGQHFLTDSSILQMMITAIMPQKNDHIIEIGAGQGALTDYLLTQVKNLDLIEIDRDLINLLTERYRNYPEVRIFAGDVLQFSFAKAQMGEFDKIRLVGNLPYNISTPLLVKVMSEIHYFSDLHFLLQKEVAERMCASVGSHHYGRLSVMTQFYCQPQLLFLVGPQSFNPPPKVWSAFIRLIPRPQLAMAATEIDSFFQLVKLAFVHRRKTLANNLKSVMSADMLSAIGIDPMLRPQQLSIPDFVKLATYLSKDSK